MSKLNRPYTKYTDAKTGFVSRTDIFFWDELQQAVDEKCSVCLHRLHCEKYKSGTIRDREQCRNWIRDTSKTDTTTGLSCWGV